MPAKSRVEHILRNIVCVPVALVVLLILEYFLKEIVIWLGDAVPLIVNILSWPVEYKTYALTLVVSISVLCSVLTARKICTPNKSGVMVGARVFGVLGFAVMLNTVVIYVLSYISNRFGGGFFDFITLVILYLVGAIFLLAFSFYKDDDAK